MFLDEAVSNLSEEGLTAFHSLADFKNSEKTNRGIYFTNCFSLGDEVHWYNADNIQVSFFSSFVKFYLKYSSLNSD